MGAGQFRLGKSLFGTDRTFCGFFLGAAGFGFRISGFGPLTASLGLRVSDLGLRASSLGLQSRASNRSGPGLLSSGFFLRVDGGDGPAGFLEAVLDCIQNFYNKFPFFLRCLKFSAEKWKNIECSYKSMGI